MQELDLQEKYIINFLCERLDGLRYKEAKANTVSPQFFIMEDLKQFISNTTLNIDNYKKLLRKFDTEKALFEKLILFLDERIKSSANMALFFNNNKTITFEGVSLHLFYPSGSEIYEDNLFNENIFSVVQELPYSFRYDDHRFSFRPDLTFFLNGIYLGYSELKSIYNNQNAKNNGRKKVAKDYLAAVQQYLKIANHNDVSQTLRKNFLKVFEKAIHITATDINETYIIRNISNLFEEIKMAVEKGNSNFRDYQDILMKDFKVYPISDKGAKKSECFEEVFKAFYDKKMIEKEILYYNFIERELIKKESSKIKEYRHNDGRLIAPRPKQKFGTDKIIAKINEFIAHESEPDYFIKKLEYELREKGIGDEKIKELIAKRTKYLNNKHVYSLLMQYSAGFGKSNIIGWTALQLKDLRKNGEYIYDKILLVVDRLQLRDQLDSVMHNMNIQKNMFIEAQDQKSFERAFQSDRRIIVVNIQKFGRENVNNILSKELVNKLSAYRIAFLIDEIHRGNTGMQHEDMVSLFDDIQSRFDHNKEYLKKTQKKNIIIGFTATPSDHTLARFGEFNKYAEAEKLWVPFDSYTMNEAIKDGYIFNPLDGIVPVSAKMYFESPDNTLKEFEGDTGYEEIPDNTETGVDEYGKRYIIRKRNIYSNPERIDAISRFIAERLVTAVYPKIRGYAKAMLAVTTIPNAIIYKERIDRLYKELTKQKKYERFKEAPVFIIYSDSQEYPSMSSLNDGLSEKQIMQNFRLAKNGLIIVVDKLQTGFDEPKLHTLFLDKEIRGINAVQTICRVNRKIKNKNNCKIIDFSYKNINVNNIKQAFEHYSNVTVTNFDPIGYEEKLDIYYKELQEHILFKKHFLTFIEYKKNKENIYTVLNIIDCFIDYIHNFEKEAKKLKATINYYFSVLNLIENVIEFDQKFKENNFLEFWWRFSIEYNQINKPDELIDDIAVYFDNKIGIVAPKDYLIKELKSTVLKDPKIDSENNQFKYSILKVIEKRNQEEEAIAELIKKFEEKIDSFFDFIRNDDAGKRLIAKILDNGMAFSQEEIFEDFSKMYRKYIIKNKGLDEFFKRETKDILPQLYDDFERDIKNPNYKS